MSEPKFTYKFAYDLDQLAREKHVKICSTSIESGNVNKKGHYDYLLVEFLIPRPDLDKPEKKTEKVDLQQVIDEVEADLKDTTEDGQKDEV